MQTRNIAPLPIDAWAADMTEAIESICDIGRRTLATHGEASEQAAETARQWKLAERLEDERAALLELFGAAQSIMKAVETLRQQMCSTQSETETLNRSMRDCAQAINTNLPAIDRTLLQVRHAALDLLRWTQLSGQLEGSELPEHYRASYGKLISYAPTFRPQLEALQEQLLSMGASDEARPEVAQLLSAITRYNSFADSARAFIKSVVDPPLELVFEDTDTFQSDWERYAPSERGTLATEFNDCCQYLLYDLDAFHRRVTTVRPELPNGMEASMFVLPVGESRVIFTVDEDPVFGQMTVTLLRIVHVSDFDQASAAVVDALYRELSGD